MPAAVVALALVSCNKEKDFTAQDPNAVQIRVHAMADELNAGDPESKTYIDTYQGTANTILWGTNEHMKIAVSVGETTHFATSADADANGNPAATFSFSVEDFEGTPSSYAYQGLYPASAAVASNNTNPANYKVNLPAIQNATATSYDPAAYIMVAQPAEKTSLVDWEDASFRRATALNKITLKNISSGVSIKRVEITVPAENYLAGGRHINLTTGANGDIYSGGGRTETIEVKYETPLEGGADIDVWFCSWGVEVEAGQILKIVAFTTDKKSFTKTITVPAGKSIKFQEGYLNTLGANMSGISPEDVTELEEGNYLILVKDGDNYNALNAETAGSNNDKIAAESYTGSLDSYAGPANMVWSVSKSEGSYIIANGSNYLGTTAAKKAFFQAAGETWTTTEYLVDITWITANSCYNVTLKNDSTLKFQYNSSSDFFAFYNSDQKDQLIFVPATVDNRTAVSLTFDNDQVDLTPAEAAQYLGENLTISPNVAAVSGHLTWDYEDNDGIIDEFDNGALTLTGDEGTATVTVSFAGDENYLPASASYTISVVDAPVGTYFEKLSSTNDVTSGEYVIASFANSKYYAMSNVFDKKIDGTEITVTDNKISESSASGYVVTLNVNGEGKVAIYNGSKYLNCVSSGTDFNVGTTATYHTLALATHGTFRISNSRALVFNGSKFGNYATSNVNGTSYWDIELFKKVDNTTWNLSSIAVTTPPTKVIYVAGESFDPSGMVVTATYVDANNSSNTKTQAVDNSALSFSPSGALSTSNTSITITYQNKTTTQSITVNAPSTISSALSSPGTYSINNVLVYAVKGNALILGDSTGKIYSYKSSHGLSKGDVRTASGNSLWYNNGDVFEFEVSSFSGSGTATVDHGTPLELDSNASSLASAFAHNDSSDPGHSAVYVHAIGSQSGRSITTSGSNVLYLSANESSTDGKTVEVYGYVYAYSASHTNFNFLVTSIEEYVDPNAKVITALKSSITGVSADGVTNATETGVYSLANASDSDVTVTPDGTVVTSASVSGGTLTYSVAANTGAARSGSVTLAVSGGNSIEITISQDKASGGTGGGTVTVWDDDFSQFTTPSTTALTSLTGSKTGFTSSYSGVSTVYPEELAIKFASSKNAGSITTPAFSALTSTSTVTVTIQAAGMNAKTGPLTFTVNNAGTASSSSATVSASGQGNASGVTSWDTISFTITGATSATTLTISAASGKQVFINSINIVTNN